VHASYGQDGRGPPPCVKIALLGDGDNLSGPGPVHPFGHVWSVSMGLLSRPIAPVDCPSALRGRASASASVRLASASIFRAARLHAGAAIYVGARELTLSAMRRNSLALGTVV